MYPRFLLESEPSRQFQRVLNRCIYTLRANFSECCIAAPIHLERISASVASLHLYNFLVSSMGKHLNIPCESKGIRVKSDASAASFGAGITYASGPPGKKNMHCGERARVHSHGTRNDPSVACRLHRTRQLRKRAMCTILLPSSML